MDEALKASHNRSLVDNPKFQASIMPFWANQGYMYLDWTAESGIFDANCLFILKLLKSPKPFFPATLRSLTESTYGSRDKLVKELY